MKAMILISTILIWNTSEVLGDAVAEAEAEADAYYSPFRSLQPPQIYQNFQTGKKTLKSKR